MLTQIHLHTFLQVMWPCTSNNFSGIELLSIKWWVGWNDTSELSIDNCPNDIFPERWRPYTYNLKMNIQSNSTHIFPDKLKHLSRMEESKRCYKSLSWTDLPVLIMNLISTLSGNLICRPWICFIGKNIACYVTTDTYKPNEELDLNSPTCIVQEAL